MRKTGYTKIQIEGIKSTIEKNKTVLVAGLKDSKLYLKMLKDSGCNAKAEPSYVNKAEEHVYDEITGRQWFQKGEKVLTGFIFSAL